MSGPPDFLEKSQPEVGEFVYYLDTGNSFGFGEILNINLYLNDGFVVMYTIMNMDGEEVTSKRVGRMDIPDIDDMLSI